MHLIRCSKVLATSVYEMNVNLRAESVIHARFERWNQLCVTGNNLADEIFEQCDRSHHIQHMEGVLPKILNVE
jgi:hypothetical protein